MVFLPHSCINYRVFFPGEQTVPEHLPEQAHCHLIHDFILFHMRFLLCSGRKYNSCGSSIFCGGRSNQKILLRSADRQILLCFWRGHFFSSRHSGTFRNRKFSDGDREYYAEPHRSSYSVVQGFFSAGLISPCFLKYPAPLRFSCIRNLWLSSPESGLSADLS